MTDEIIYMHHSDYQYGDGICNDCGLIWSASNRFETCPRCESSNTKFKFVSTNEEDLFMPETLVPKDYMGKSIKAGDTVVYPVRQGSEMWLQHMIVSHIEVIRATVPVFKLHGTNSDGHLVKIQHANRCVVI